MSSEKVTVFIPTYNSVDKITETVESVISQTYTNIEIICVDDGSTDKTRSILQDLSTRDSRIKFFYKKNEGSVPYSWNYIFPVISGKFTFYMSHDDILSADCIEKMVEASNRRGDIDCVIPTVRFFERCIDEGNGVFDDINLKYSSYSGQVMSGKDAFNLMLDYTIPGFALWRTSLIKRIGMPTVSFNSDEFAQRLWVKYCRSVAFSDGVFGYRQTEGSIVKGFRPSHLYSLDSNLRLFKEFVNEDCVPLKRKQTLQYHYYETLLYLSAKYNHIKDDLSDEDRMNIGNLIDMSWDELSNKLCTPVSLKGVLVKSSALCRPIFNLITMLKI